MKYNKYNGLFNKEIYHLCNRDISIDNYDFKLNRYLDHSYGKAYLVKDFTYRLTKKRLKKGQFMKSLQELLETFRAR